MEQKTRVAAVAGHESLCEVRLESNNEKLTRNNTASHNTTLAFEINQTVGKLSLNQTPIA